MDADGHEFKPDVVLVIPRITIEPRIPGLRECLN